MPPKRTRLPSKSEGSSVKNDTGAVKRKRMADSPSLPPPEKATYDGPIDEDEGDGKTMTPADLQFLKDCLKFVVGGTVVVDIVAIAEARGQKNPRSVQNRLTQMRNRHGLPFRASNGGSSPIKPVVPTKRKPTGRPPGSNSTRVSTAKITNSDDAADSDPGVTDDPKEKERRAEVRKLQFLKEEIAGQVLEAPPPPMSQATQEKNSDTDVDVYEEFKGFEGRVEVDVKVKDEGGEEELHVEAVSKEVRLRD